MLQAIIYARYSTDNQNPKSIEDQIAHCKDFINSRGSMRVIRTFADRAISGTKIDRKGLEDMLIFIETNRIDAVIVESIDRFSRNSGDIHRLYEIFEFYNVKMISVNEGGEVSELLIGVKGTMNAITVKETALRVERAHKARAREGLLPGGKAYGYRVKLDNEGRQIPGKREIVEEQADIVRRIFQMYADGAGCKSIVRSLNIEGIPSPTGRYWSPSTILGTRKRAAGILSNNIYRGKLVYNRSKKITNPMTKRTKTVIKNEKYHIKKDIPELRIVCDELWYKVQSRIFSKKDNPKTPPPKANPSHSRKYLSGMVFCGVCGSKCQRANHTRYVCGAYRTYRTCKNARGIKNDRLVEEIFAELIKYIDNEKNFVRSFKKIFDEENQEIKAKNALLENINRRINAYQTILDDGVYLPEISEGLILLQQEKAEILSQLHKKIPEVYSEKLTKKLLIEEGLEILKQGYYKGEFAQSWRAAMSLMVDMVGTTPIPDKKKGMTIEVKIASIEGWAEFYRRITAKN